MEPPPLERRLAAILAADVEGYSRLMHGDEETTMATFVRPSMIMSPAASRRRQRSAQRSKR